MSQPHDILDPTQMLEGIERTRVLNEDQTELAPLIDAASEEFPSGVGSLMAAGATRRPMLCLKSLQAEGAPL